MLGSTVMKEVDGKLVEATVERPAPRRVAAGAARSAAAHFFGSRTFSQGLVGNFGEHEVWREVSAPDRPSTVAPDVQRPQTQTRHQLNAAATTFVPVGNPSHAGDLQQPRRRPLGQQWPANSNPAHSNPAPQWPHSPPAMQASLEESPSCKHRHTGPVKRF